MLLPQTNQLLAEIPQIFTNVWRHYFVFEMHSPKGNQVPSLKNAQQENINANTIHRPIDQSKDQEPHLKPQGIFVYGTLMAEEFLSWLLTGSSENHNTIISIRQPAILTHYRRVVVNHGDYPALIPGSESDKVEGFLIVPSSTSQWKKIDDFEGESYRRHCVHVHLPQVGKTVPAHVYLWQENMDKLLPYKDWSFRYFRENRLQDWLDLFDGMEMVGEG